MNNHFDESASGVFKVHTDRNVIVVGVGNIGSKIVPELVSAGVSFNQLVLVDPDEINPHNIANQLNGSSLGEFKVVGMQRTLKHFFIKPAEQTNGNLTDVYKYYLGTEHEDFTLEDQRQLINDAILIIAIDSAEGMKNIYNNLLRYVSPYLVCVANFSKIYRDNKGQNSACKVTILPHKDYYYHFFNGFAASLLEKEREDTVPACKQLNCSIPGQFASIFLVSRLVNFLRYKANELPPALSTDLEALEKATGVVCKQEIVVIDDEEYINNTSADPAEDYHCSMLFDLTTHEQVCLKVQKSSDLPEITVVRPTE